MAYLDGSESDNSKMYINSKVETDKENEIEKPRRKREGMYEKNKLRGPIVRINGGLREGGANVNDVYKTYE